MSGSMPDMIKLAAEVGGDETGISGGPKVWAICSYFGRSAVSADTDAIYRDGAVVWPTGGESLRDVAYFEDKAHAAEVMAALGSHRDGDLVALAWHFRDAGYVGIGYLVTRDGVFCLETGQPMQ